MNTQKKAVIDQRLTDIEYRIYSYLTFKRFPIFITNKAIANLFKCSPLLVKKALKKLRELDYIKQRSWWFLVEPNHVRKTNIIAVNN